MTKTLEKLAGLSYFNVKIGDEFIKGRGLTLTHLIVILQEFKEIRELLSGEKGLDERGLPGLLFDLGPEFVGALIASSISELVLENGSPKIDEASREIAKNLPIDIQFLLLEEIIKVSIPLGVGAFMKNLNRAMEAVTKSN